MNQEIYDKIKTWFDGYVNSFSTENKELEQNIEIIRDHSYRVVGLIEEFVEQANLSESDFLLAKITALLHDIGRFNQLIVHGTFADTDKINHSAIGILLLTEQESITNTLSEETKSILIECIRFHNLREIPKSVNERSLPILLVLRDADRLDNLELMAEYYSEHKSGFNKRLELELADNTNISKKVHQSIMEEKVVDSKHILGLSDFKLQQMSWIFDFQFKRSFQIASEKTYLKRMYECLPKKDIVIDMYRQMKIYMENQL
ncbi:HD domain-containing protein [Ancylomarina longa]|uniref:HD domain-containing protein n=1 Tax=Ancylomarina longa TaxID=2487017 RepID=UPI001ADE88C8|nr:HD domain-containing protein [Ancylomarina longa]